MLKNGIGRYRIFFNFYTKLAESPFLCCFHIESVNMFVLPRFDLYHVLSSSTNNFAHAQTLSRMSSLSDRMNIARVNIGFFIGCKKIKQQRISFVLGYLRMILWKISTAISIKHRILATINNCFPLKLTKVAYLIQGVWYKILYHHTVVIKEWRDVARDFISGLACCVN